MHRRLKNDLRGDAPTLGSLIQWGNLLSISLDAGGFKKC
jgi:hypothetical protein